MKKTFFAFSRLEKILVLLFSMGIFFGAMVPFFSFSQENTSKTPTKGGVYREGVVADGNSLVLNPVYIHGKREMSVESDIVNLLFRGLMSFNSKTGELEDSLGEHFLSPDKKTYTFRLKEGLRWHDGQPLTADDVIFTYHDVIQHEDFSNDSLKNAFQDVLITKVNSREVEFRINYPYKFFLTNFTVGLLPKHVLKDVPVAQLEFHEFSQNPVGNGSFSFGEVEEVRPSVFRLSLNAFQTSTIADPMLHTIEFWMYPSKESLSLDSRKLNGVKPFSKYLSPQMFINSHLEATEFVLPQYAALFFNVDKEIFQGDSGKKLRLALQVGTDKEKILEVTNSIRVDTPLLETRLDEWLYEFSFERANGALKDAGYFFPSKKPKTRIPEKSSEKWITGPTDKPELELESGEFVLEGVFPAKARRVEIFVEGVNVVEHDRENIGSSWRSIYAPKWDFLLSAPNSLLAGTQEIRVKFFSKDKELIFQDALSVYLDPVEFEKIKKEVEALSEEAPTTTVQESTQGEESASEEEIEKAESSSSLTEETVKESSSEESAEVEFSGLNTEESTETTSAEPNEDSKAEEEKEPKDEVKKALEEVQTPIGEIRETFDGEPLKLSLLTATSPGFYPEVAAMLQEDWKKFGVDLSVTVLPPQEFLDAVSHREYDILLFGENLGYNLDIYAFFHKSQSGKGNLSNYKSEEASILIEEIRSSHVPEVRANKLAELQKILQNDIPAVFLFSPVYVYYSDPNVKGMEIEKIAIMKDRFFDAENWYMKTEKTFHEDVSIVDYPSWFFQKFISFITFSL